MVRFVGEYINHFLKHCSGLSILKPWLEVWFWGGEITPVLYSVLLKHIYSPEGTSLWHKGREQGCGLDGHEALNPEKSLKSMI